MNENTQRNDKAVIPTNPECLPNSEAEILLDSNVAYEGSNALSNTELD